MRSKEDSTRTVIQCLCQSIFDRLRVFWENYRSAHDQRPFRCRLLYMHIDFKMALYLLTCSAISPEFCTKQ